MRALRDFLRHSLRTLAIAAAMLAGPAMAQSPLPAGGEHAPPVPLLWKVSQGEHALYLLGSFHLLTPQDYPLSPDVTAVQARVDKLVMELSPKEMNSPELPLKMAQAAMRRDGRTLDSQLPEATRKRLAAWVKANAAELNKAQIPPQVLQMFQPWFVGLTITLVEFGKYGLDPALGLDKHMGDGALGRGIPTAGLETADEQIAMLSGMSEAQQLEFLDESLASVYEGPDEIRRLHDLWRSGDADGLWQQMALPMREQFPELYARINVERNDAWLPRLEELLADPAHRETLVVVGAMHVVGEDGVVEKLRARGYEVERICSACVEPVLNGVGNGELP